MIDQGGASDQMPNHRLERTARQFRYACYWVSSSLRSSADAQTTP